MSKNVSDNFKNIIKTGGAFYAYAKVTLSNGSTFELDSKNNFMSTGNGYSEGSESGFPLGSAISKSIRITIDNALVAEELLQDTTNENIQDTTGDNISTLIQKFSTDLYNARIVLYTEVDIPNGTQERVQEGIFTVVDSVYPGEVIEITAYDDMYKADQEFVSKLTYPVSAQMLLNEVCDYCDITLGSASFKNNDFQIQQPPNKLTGRQIIGYIAQIAVGNAYVDYNGRLQIKSYALSEIEEEIDPNDIETESGKHIISQYTSDPTISVEDVIITGVSTTIESEDYSKEDETYLVGSEDYAIKIDNPLISGNEKKAVDLISDVIIGMKFRPFSGTFIPNPTIEFMDECYLVDRKDNVYYSFVTLHDFDYLGNSMIANETDPPQKYNGTYYSEASEAYQKAKKGIEINKNQWEQAIENLSQQVANSSGLYTTKEEQPDGSTIFYMHNKPTLEESDIVWKMTAETLTVSTDGGKTWNAGITVNGEVIARILSTIGINFDWGVGGTLIIQDTDGNQTAYIDADTGEIRLTVTSLSIQGKNVNEIAADEIENFVNEVYDPEIEKLQNQIDKKSDTWYQATDPSLSWTETEESVLQDTTGEDILDTIGDPIIGILEIGKTVHEGDQWKNSDTNVEYIYQDGQWIEMPIPDAVFDEIDGKARIFVTTPVPPYSERDLWMQGPDGDIMTCVHGRESGSFVSSDWEVKQKYTDDTAVGELDLALDKQGVFDRLTNYGEVKGIFLESDGQLYINASYLMTGILKVSQPGASGKETFYANMDTGEVRIVANSFSLTNGDTIDSIAQGAVDDLDTSLDQQEVFNRLTNNGQAQGITLHKNGQLYINAEYIQSLILKVGGANNENGTFEVYNGSGVLVGKIDKDGAKFTNGNDWLQIQNSLMTGGYGGTTDGLLDLSANYSGGERHVVLESKTGDVILKSSGDFLVERPGTGQGTLLQSGNYQYLTDVGDVEITSSETEELRAIALGESVSRDASNNPIDALALIRKDTLSKVFYEGDYFSYFSSHIITGWRFVSLSTPTTIAPGYSWDLTANAAGSGIPYRTGTEYLVIPVSTGWGAVGSIDQPTSAYGQGSTNFTVTLINNGSSAHIIGCTCLVLGLLSRDLSPLS